MPITLDQNVMMSSIKSQNAFNEWIESIDISDSRRKNDVSLCGWNTCDHKCTYVESTSSHHKNL